MLAEKLRVTPAMGDTGMTKEWVSQTHFFADEDGTIIFNIVIEHPWDKTPPAELVELIELYSKGYRVKKED